MARFEMTRHDQYRISKAREELAAAKRLDLSDDRAVIRTLARLEIALAQLLEMLGEDGAA
ncbi:hypothetical protein ABZ387_07020 [Streptomyces flaveolus]|uniref:hypothetical protein n=1 Tax=Streptomyces flaveolus TaxID=67297 RepID=UPI0033FE1DB4